MPDLPNDLIKLEAALAGLTPASGRLNRDRLLYEAGRRAARPRVAPIIATMFAGLSAVLALQLTLRPEPQPREIEVVRVVPAKTLGSESGPSPETVVAHTSEPNWGNAFRSSAGYLSLRNRVLYFGTDTLLSAPPPAPAASKHPELEDQVLPGRTWNRPL